MKLTKLMLSALAAIVALAACNKDGLDTEGPKTLKSVEVNLGNIVFTKGTAGNPISAGQAVKVTDIQLFLADEDGNFYQGYDATKTTTQSGYYTSVTTGTTADTEGNFPVGDGVSFHFVDPKVTKVIAVANIGTEKKYSDYKDLTTLLGEIDNLSIGGEQNQDDLTLYAESTLTKKEENHTTDTDGGSTVENQVYTAEVTLAPRISRFEIDGFHVAYDSEGEGTPEFNNVTFNKIGFVNYMPNASLSTGEVSGTVVNPLSSYYSGTTVSNEAGIYEWFAAELTEDENKWIKDSFTAETTPAAPTATLSEKLAYHFFSGTTVPTFFIQLTADSVPGFIYTKGFKDANGNTISEFKPGTIYRMDAVSTDTTGDGLVPVDPDIINTMERCLEVTVEVVPWTVVLVTPEF